MPKIKLTLAAMMALSLTACVSTAASVIGNVVDQDTGQKVTSIETPNTKNPYGITGVVNTRDAQSLHNSLEAMVGGLSQADQLAFMESFFRVAQLDRCDETGQWRTLGNSFNGGRKSFRRCAATAATASYFDELAQAYVADKRMDTNYAYTATNLYGTRTGGASARQSYVTFISLYGDVMDGRDADYIHWRNSLALQKKAKSQRGHY